MGSGYERLISAAAYFCATGFDPFMEGAMWFVAAALAVLSGLFYAAGKHEIGDASLDLHAGEHDGLQARAAAPVEL